MNSSLLSFISDVVNWGAIGGALFLVVTGWLIPKSAHDDVKADAANWHAAYNEEHQAHQATRDALVLANERTEAAVETAKLARALLEEARQHAGGTRALEA